MYSLIIDRIILIVYLQNEWDIIPILSTGKHGTMNIKSFRIYSKLIGLNEMKNYDSFINRFYSKVWLKLLRNKFLVV